MTRSRSPWLLLFLPVLPLLLLARLLARRRARPGLRNGPGGPPPAGVREPRRPKPSPPAAALTLTEPGRNGNRPH
ncbi:hypothetical protein ACFOSC_17830 [Streptantibioticus rubrisoli]|uniref:Uncharacterized protein n=1 Tax=Streptantibioticus rubrisoli TaxID=1387313 RepID=A0ABT1PH73_9ACTN|nr:hypothetical protein [Streptantibioticus rubrisoli]MCQ4044704.1 hypothetical protein [Streptantibioticus rubrisoli]